MSDTNPVESTAVNIELMEVRYSLKEMMLEVSKERKESSMGKEIVDQSEIQTLFKNKKKKKRK